MPSIPHVHRRGAVYYWRRRPPQGHGLGSHFVLSLRTTNQAVARQLAARLDEEMLRMFEPQSDPSGDHRLTGDQMKAIFAGVALRHAHRLERVAAFERLQPSFDIEDSRASDVAMGYVYRLLATHGPAARMTKALIGELEAAGLSEAVIERVATYLVELRRNGGHADRRARLECLLEAVEAPSTAVNLHIAQTTKHRAMAAALLDADRRWGIALGEDAELFGAIARKEAGDLSRARSPARPSAPTAPDPLPTPGSPRPSVDVILDEQGGPLEPGTPHEPARQQDCGVSTTPKRGLEPASQGRRREPAEAGGRPTDVAELLLAGSMMNVDVKTKRQVRSLGRLLEKYLGQIHSIFDLRDLGQRHLAAFFAFLQTELYIHYGKSESDEDRSIAELRQIWKTKDKALLGVDKPTAERYAGQIKQLIKTARANGVIQDRDLTFEGLIANSARQARARNARPTMTVAQSESLFQQPPFVGCKAWDRMDEPGNLVFHRAEYYATILCQYGGARREEICGAMVTDVIVDNGPIPYLYLETNKFRRLKNPQSQRPVPIHPEPIRLGFLAYVETIKSLGYELLFPDLFSPTSSSPLGDRFHDNLRPILNKAGITAKGTGMHSSRRGFGNNLKQKRVDDEMRADLLGHGGDSETTERYCERFEIETLYEDILKLPNVTGHLEPREINLLPWIATKQPPSFSHPSRTKEAKMRRNKS